MLNPKSPEYCVVEINPRVSCPSALASKTVGYPITKAASKIALGCTLGEIQNVITKKAHVCSEPTPDYCVVKIPRWPLNKFVHARRSLGTQMKTTGEITGIAPTSGAALTKPIRCLEQNMHDLTDAELDGLLDLGVSKRIHTMDDRRLFTVAEALRRGFAVEKIHSVMKIGHWFLQKLQSTIAMEKRLANEPMSKELLLEARPFGLLDETIAKFSSISTEETCGLKEEQAIYFAYKMVNTRAAKLETETPYYYPSYGDENESCHESGRKEIMVIGSGPIRISRGIEFDFCPAYSVWAPKKLGFKTIIVSNNPETVSTDLDIADKLYFEPSAPEDAWHTVELEKPDRAAVQFGDQIAIKLTDTVEKMGIPSLGTSSDSIDEAEDRECFDAILAECRTPHAVGCMVLTCGGALHTAHELDYPVLVHPSYVLGGQGMDTVYNDNDIHEQIDIISAIAQEHLTLMDKYLMDIEVGVDVICNGADTLIPGIIQHVEYAGVHSNDSISIYPAQSLLKQVGDTIVDCTRKLALALRVRGFLDIQFIVKDKQVYVIEANLRSSRAVPHTSKITDIPVVRLTARTFFGEALPQMGCQYGLQPNRALIAIKMSVSSFEELYGVDVSLGPEVKSIGEVFGIARSPEEIMIRAFRGAGMHLLINGSMIITVKDQNKEETLPIAKGLCDLDWAIYSTEGISNYLKENGIPNVRLNKVGGDASDIPDATLSGIIDLVINTPSKDTEHRYDGFLIRHNTVGAGIPCPTSLDTANAFLRRVQYVEGTNLSVVDIMKVSSPLVLL